MEICNILIVEDDLFQRRILERMLSTINHAHIHTASNGIEALERVKKTIPDVIFCDLYMPEMDGVEFVRQLADQGISPTVVFTSSAASDVQSAVIEMSRSYGIKKVTNLIKPLKREQVSEMLDWVAQETLPTHTKANVDTTINNQDIKRALYSDEFVPFFQAHFDARNGRLIGAESLIRWQHPSLGILTPIHFLDQLVELGLSYQLSCIMIRRSIDIAASWHRAGWQMGISVNVTPSDLEHDDFADRVIQILEEARFPPNKLTLEVTETELATDLARSLENTSRLRMRGVSISIDDFGTGHSSLTQLISSPFTELKIDQFFVKEMLQNDKHLAAIRFVIALSKSLDLKVVAEGVETQGQARRLAQLGCDVLQGYYLAKPMSAQNFFEYCQKHFQKRIEKSVAVTE
ncbi:EAL domain-containing protein [Vibrio maerlii]|uniref:EAL domain-containing response regulator n=1 Tax=Vibrio maerlii TaxID=2231648 RepID=UPI000E3C5DA6|nr:EAL domain-containing response regulator [Vibrio maerlii]